MNVIEYESWVSALLRTLTQSDAQSIRHAVSALIHDDQLADSHLSKLESGEQGSLYSLKVPPKFSVILRRSDDSKNILEVVDLVNDNSIRKLREAQNAELAKIA